MCLFGQVTDHDSYHVLPRTIGVIYPTHGTNMDFVYKFGSIPAPAG